MAIRVTWRCTKPNLGLREAMARMAEEIAYEGEYSEVEILYELRSFPNCVTSFES
jgi:hypothetical protein